MERHYDGSDKNRLLRWEVDGSNSRSCAIQVFGNSDAKPLSSTTKRSVNYFIYFMFDRILKRLCVKEISKYIFSGVRFELILSQHYVQQFSLSIYNAKFSEAVYWTFEIFYHAYNQPHFYFGLSGFNVNMRINFPSLTSLTETNIKKRKPLAGT